MFDREDCSDPELFDEIVWVMKNYGSDALEAKQPGSKLHSQALRIVEFVNQREEARRLFRNKGFGLVKIVSSTIG